MMIAARIPKQARQAVRPDRRVRTAKRRGGQDLRPIGADGLLVARGILKPDIDEIAAFHHLAAGLHIARLVTVHRRNGEEAGQHRRQRYQHQKKIGVAIEPATRTLCLERVEPVIHVTTGR